MKASIKQHQDGQFTRYVLRLLSYRWVVVGAYEVLTKIESLLLISGRSQMDGLGDDISETFSGMTSPRSLLMPLRRCSIRALSEALRISSIVPRPISMSDWERVCRLLGPEKLVALVRRGTPSVEVWDEGLRGKVP
jgi:hypothetical protein